jgi:hypothetical protein
VRHQSAAGGLAHKLERGGRLLDISRGGCCLLVDDSRSSARASRSNSRRLVGDHAPAAAGAARDSPTYTGREQTALGIALDDSAQRRARRSPTAALERARRCCRA